MIQNRQHYANMVYFLLDIKDRSKNKKTRENFGEGREGEERRCLWTWTEMTFVVQLAP